MERKFHTQEGIDRIFDLVNENRKNGIPIYKTLIEVNCAKRTFLKRLSDEQKGILKNSRIFMTDDDFNEIFDSVIDGLKGGIEIKDSLKINSIKHSLFYKKLSDLQKSIILKLRKELQLTEDEIKEKCRQYRRNNIDKLRANGRIYQQLHSDERKIYLREYYRNNVDRAKEYAVKNKDKIRSRMRIWTKENWETIKVKHKPHSKAFYFRHKDQIKIKSSIREKEYRESLNDSYIKRRLRGDFKIHAETLNKYPELIKIKRSLMSINRKLKQVK